MSTITSSPSSSSSSSAPSLEIGLPKGRMQQNVFKLLNDGGIDVSVPDRGYRPHISLRNVSAKLLKPQNIIEMLMTGTRDLGFGGADWVAELSDREGREKAENLIELLDTGLDPVRIVVAAPQENFIELARKAEKPLRIASEYEYLTKRWIKENKLNAVLVKTFGATECFPPEDADAIVDNTATGSTLKANGLFIVDTVLHSSTRVYASKQAMGDAWKRERISEFILLLKSVIAARERVMVTFNVQAETLEKITATLPCMRAPTISPLYSPNTNGASNELSGKPPAANSVSSSPAVIEYAVSICAPKSSIATLLPQLKGSGATDIVVLPISQIIA